MYEFIRQVRNEQKNFFLYTRNVDINEFVFNFLSTAEYNDGLYRYVTEPNVMVIIITTIPHSL